LFTAIEKTSDGKRTPYSSFTKIGGYPILLSNAQFYKVV